MKKNLEERCKHNKLYIIGIEQEEEGFKGQYWYNCVDCKTTGIDPLKGYQATMKEVDDHFVYIKTASYIPSFYRRTEK